MGMAVRNSGWGCAGTYGVWTTAPAAGGFYARCREVAPVYVSFFLLGPPASIESMDRFSTLPD